MKKIIASLAIALAVTGCSDLLPEPYPEYANDQSKRHEYFQACMAALPAGPQTTRYNDWDEVVDACSRAASYQSLYCVANCPPEPAALPKGGAA